MKLRNLIAGACALCCGIAAAAPLTKYTVTRPETVRVQNAVSLQSAERMLFGTSKLLAAAYPENIIHTITFNISDPQSAAVDEPFAVEVQEEQDVTVGIVLPESYDYLGCAITTEGRSYDIERDLDALHEMGVFPDLAHHEIRFLFVTRDFEVGLVCNLPKYVDARNGTDDGNTTGSYDNPVRTITRALDLLGYQKGTVNVNPGVYAPVVIEQDVEIRIVAHGRVSECVIDGGGTNRCAQLGRALGDVKAKIVGFTLRNGDAGDQHGGGVRFGQVERCRVIDCRTKGDGGGLYGVAARDTLVALCSAGGQGNLADKSTLRNCTLRDSSSAGWALTTSGCRNCVVTSEGGATLLSGVDTFDHSVSNAVYACPGDRYSGYLAENSPGLAAGDVDVTIDGETDLDGKPRLTQGDYAATVDCGCYEGVPVLCTVHGDIKGVNPWGTSDFTMVEGSDLILPYGYSVIELSVGGEPVPQPPGGGTVIITNVQNSTTFSAYIVASRYADIVNGDDRNDGYTPETAKRTLQAAIDCAPEAIEDPMYSRVFAAPGEYDMIETHDRKLTVEGIGGAGRVTLVGRVIERGTFGDGFHIPSIYPTIVAKLCKDDQVTYSYPPGVHVFTLMPKRFIGEGVNTVLSGFTIERRATDEEIGSSTSTAADAMVVGGTLVACVIKNTSAAFPAARNTVMRNTLVTYGADFGGAGGTGCSYANCTIVPSGTATANALTASNAVRLANCVLSGRYTMNAEVGDREPIATVTNGAVFVDAAKGDYHLAEGSAGLAAGDLAYVVDKTDLDGRLRTTMNGGVETVDCGCYETEVRQPWPTCKVTGSFTGLNPFGTNEFDVTFGGVFPLPLPPGYEVESLTVDGVAVDARDLPSAGEPLFRTLAHDGMTFTARIRAFRYADAANGNDANDGCTPATAKKTLQAAIDVAPTPATDADLSRVYVAPGIYAPIATSDRRLTIIGTAGAKETIIDGGGTNRCADLGGADESGRTNTVLRGFTIRKGYIKEYGGGVRGGTVIACIVTDNTAGDYGGGVSYSTVRDSLLARNVNTLPSPPAYGGAGYGGSYYNCTIVGNSAPNGEGDKFSAGIYGADALVNCVVQDNFGKNGVEKNNFIEHGVNPIATIQNGAVFANAAKGDYRLKPGSKGIAEGNVAYVMDETDLDGCKRTTTRDGKTTVNCGCYETLGPESIRYVDAAKGDDGYDGLTPATPMKTIQKAIDDIADGTTSADSVIYVAPGTYEPIATANRKLTIIGTAGAKKTIIDGGLSRRCADLGGANESGKTNTVLRGFTVRNGSAGRDGGGGVRGGTVIACIVTDNTAEDYGGGVRRSVVRNSLLARNVNTFPGFAYGGAGYSGSYYNCTIVSNSAPKGVGDGFSAGIFSADALVNCVVQGNYGENGVEMNYHKGSSVYGGSGADPIATVTNGAVFVDAEGGDYRLRSSSAGIAQGEVAYVMDETDLDGKPRTTTKGGKTTVNCGCYETLGPESIRYVDAAKGDDGYDGQTAEKPMKTIQRAIDDIPDGTTSADSVIYVAPGTYEPIVSDNRKLTIIGTAGAKRTIIDGGGARRCADLNGGHVVDDMTNTVVRGFTICNGFARVLGIDSKHGEGGGVLCGTVIDCIITNNLAGHAASGVSRAVARNCLIAGNRMTDHKSDESAVCGGRFWNCTFADNRLTNGTKCRTFYDVIDLNNCLVDCVVTSDLVWNWNNTVTSGAVFADAANGDYHLKPDSAGVAAGDLAYVMDETDLDGVARTTTKDGKTTVNCGCYETKGAFKLTMTYTGIDPYGTNMFEVTDYAGNGPLVPRGSAVVELAVDGVNIDVLPQVGEPLVKNVTHDSAVTVKFRAFRYADAANGDDAYDGLSPDRAKQTLQAAIDVAPKSATDADWSRVYAAPGTYAPIVTANEKLSIIGTEGAKETIIDGGGTNRCADLNNGMVTNDKTNTVVRGFTIRNGYAKYVSPDDQGEGGGVLCGTVIDCIITNNKADFAASGVARVEARNCLIAGNRMTASGIFESAVRGGHFWNCTFADSRRTDGMTCRTFYDGLSLYNCLMDWAANNEKVWNWNNTVTNGAVFANAAHGDYRLLEGSAGIAKGNVAYVMDETDLDGVARTTTKGGKTTVNCGCYETVVPLPESYTVRGVFHGYNPWGTDELTVARGGSLIVPERTVVLSLAVDGKPVSSLPQAGEPIVSDVTSDKAVVAKFARVTYADAIFGRDEYDGSYPGLAKKTLQAAIDTALDLGEGTVESADDNLVIVAPGTYAPIATANEKLSIIGTEGAKETIIDGGGTRRCADLNNGVVANDMTNTVVRGFTIRNGYAKRVNSDLEGEGGGVLCGTVIDCIITNNKADFAASGVARVEARNCLIAGNRMTRSGTYESAVRGGHFWNCTFADSCRTDGAKCRTFFDGLSLYNCLMDLAANNERVWNWNNTVTNGAVFADAANGDYHLRPGSAGIAEGDLAYVMDETDLDGKARTTTRGGKTTVNCGCYETVAGEEPEYVTIEDGGETYRIPYVWLEGYGLVPAGADYDTHYAAAVADSANPVGPGAAATLPTWKSYVAGLDPTNGVEMFYAVIEAPSNGWFRVGPNEIRHNREYTVVERGVLSEERGGKSEEGGVWSEEGGVKVWPIPDGETGVDVEDNGTNSFFRVNVRVK